MELLADVGHMESHFVIIGDSVSIGARWVLSLRQTYPRLRYHFRRTRRYHYVTRLEWKLVSVRLEIVLILMQHKCTVCVEHTVCSEIILDGPNGTPR